MSVEENKTLARSWYSRYDAGEPAPDELLATDFRFYMPGKPEPFDRAGARQVLAMYEAAFAGDGHTIEEEVAEGDAVVLRWTWHGTHRGDLMGLPPTGKRVRLTGIGIFRVVGGRIAELRTEFDALGLMQQLGAIPAPEHAE